MQLSRQLQILLDCDPTPECCQCLFENYYEQPSGKFFSTLKFSSIFLPNSLIEDSSSR